MKPSFGKAFFVSRVSLNDVLGWKKFSFGKLLESFGAQTGIEPKCLMQAVSAAPICRGVGLMNPSNGVL